ncbi:MAG: hypothetical protein LBB82_02335 [Treponema sp.]|jgi:hypothetical protein|nr:hypothetical protein [Treponema sp.]
MAANRTLWRFLLLFSAGFLFAQNVPEETLAGSGKNSFRVVETSRGLQIMQRLVWFRDENDFRYEVIIEKQDENGNYAQILYQERDDNFIELSLSVGRYRYRVLVYNLLDKLEYSTNWAVFSINPARQPVLDRISPNRFTLTGKDEKSGKDERDRKWIIEMRGANLLPESEVTLRPVTGGDALLPEAYTAFPGEKGGQVVFYAGDLHAGRYELQVRNPGGFETGRECTVMNGSSSDLFISASYVPAVPLHGYLSELFNGGIYPLGFSLQAGFLPLKRNWGSLGAEASVFWNHLSVTKTDLTASVHLFDFQVNLLYQYTLSPYLAFAARLGGGPVLIHALSYNIGGSSQAPISTWVISMDGGLSLKWLFHPHGFAELGISYVNLFSVEGPQGFLLPFIGAGWTY